MWEELREAMDRGFGWIVDLKTEILASSQATKKGETWFSQAVCRRGEELLSLIGTF